MSRHGVSFVLVAVLSTALPTMARSQETSTKAFAALTTDSAAWQRVLVYVVGALAHTLVIAAADPAAQPWRLQLPSGEPEAQLLRRQLRTVLRARQVMPADTLVRSLELGPLLISNDTARVEVRFSETRRCPGSSRTTGSGWSTTVLIPREPTKKFWGTAFSRTMMAGDRVSCIVR